MEDYLISMGVAVLLAAIKNPHKKEQIKNIARKVWITIGQAYPDFKNENV